MRLDAPIRADLGPGCHPRLASITLWAVVKNDRETARPKQTKRLDPSQDPWLEPLDVDPVLLATAVLWSPPRKPSNRGRSAE